jgi:hypothetical protein
VIPQTKRLNALSAQARSDRGTAVGVYCGTYSIKCIVDARGWGDYGNLKRNRAHVRRRTGSKEARDLGLGEVDRSAFVWQRAVTFE